MKKNHSPKKISPYDKFQALRRKPSYKADYWDFCKKYNIFYLFNPSTDIFKHWVVLSRIIAVTYNSSLTERLEFLSLSVLNSLKNHP